MHLSSGGVHKLRLQEKGGRWSKKSTFCKLLYHRKCKRRGVGGQKKTNLVNVVCERPLIQEIAGKVIYLRWRCRYLRYALRSFKYYSKDLSMHFSLELGVIHKLRLQDLSFFDHLPPSVYIF